MAAPTLRLVWQRKDDAATMTMMTMRILIAFECGLRCLT